MKSLFALADACLFGLMGEAATYTSQEYGEVQVSVIPERDVEVLDDAGAYVRRTILGMTSGAVKASSGDILALADTGERFRVEGLLSDDGMVMKLRARATA